MRGVPGTSRATHHQVPSCSHSACGPCRSSAECGNAMPDSQLSTRIGMAQPCTQPRPFPAVALLSYHQRSVRLDVQHLQSACITSVLHANAEPTLTHKCDPEAQHLILLASRSYWRGDHVAALFVLILNPNPEPDSQTRTRPAGFCAQCAVPPGGRAAAGRHAGGHRSEAAGAVRHGRGLAARRPAPGRLVPAAGRPHEHHVTLLHAPQRSSTAVSSLPGVCPRPILNPLPQMR